MDFEELKRYTSEVDVQMIRLENKQQKQEEKSSSLKKRKATENEGGKKKQLRFTEKDEQPDTQHLKLQDIGKNELLCQIFEMSKMTDRP